MGTVQHTGLAFVGAFLCGGIARAIFPVGGAAGGVVRSPERCLCTGVQGCAGATGGPCIFGEDFRMEAEQELRVPEGPRWSGVLRWSTPSKLQSRQVWPCSHSSRHAIPTTAHMYASGRSALLVVPMRLLGACGAGALGERRASGMGPAAKRRVSDARAALERRLGGARAARAWHISGAVSERV